ncbi:hypothetical protein PB1_06152 [Bacillus methanolicus PB1]|uniref:Uncharacterized protein n=1 Tax=Bacillus methanolicus PB1 TaxID=997296 RepID=I3E0A3_BACMT|nr:hypothetical protein [Bacillus methanolicus]EIJ79924.1 hypothetical protein PB1_06152 [Bacillus methanolicus PB1]
MSKIAKKQPDTKVGLFLMPILIRKRNMGDRTQRELYASWALSRPMSTFSPYIEIYSSEGHCRLTLFRAMDLFSIDFNLGNKYELVYFLFFATL